MELALLFHDIEALNAQSAPLLVLLDFSELSPRGQIKP